MGVGEFMTVMWAECQEENGMHFIVPDYVLPELIDPKTEEVIEWEDGERGELVYTAIDREATPLVRFRSKDHVIVWTDECECGRTSYRIRCFGRTDDMIIVKGVNVFPSAVRDIISTFVPQVTGNMQIVLNEPGPRVAAPVKIEVEYAPNVGKDVIDELKIKIEEALRTHLLFAANVKFVPPGSLERFTYKAKLIRFEE
jgi:phenylacetate-CoA ligase